MPFAALRPSSRCPRWDTRSGGGGGPGGAVVFACLAMLVAYLPFAEISASVAALVPATRAGPGAATWIGDGYAVAPAAAVLPAGALAARVGARRVSTTGLAATVLGAVAMLAVGVAPGMAVALLLTGAVVSGLGGGLVMSASLALVSASARTPAERARGLGLWSAALVVGLGAGPFVAAALLAVAPWYTLTVPAAVQALLVMALGRRVPEAATVPGRLDVAGAVLAAASVVGLVAGIVGAGVAGWTSWAAVGPLVARDRPRWPTTRSHDVRAHRHREHHHLRRSRAHPTPGPAGRPGERRWPTRPERARHVAGRRRSARPMRR